MNNDKKDTIVNLLVGLLVVVFILYMTWQFGRSFGQKEILEKHTDGMKTAYTLNIDKLFKLSQQNTQNEIVLLNCLVKLRDLQATIGGQFK